MTRWILIVIAMHYSLFEQTVFDNCSFFYELIFIFSTFFLINIVSYFCSWSNNCNIMLLRSSQGPEVRSGDVPKPIMLKEGQEFNFTIKRGVSSENTVSVNYDDFVNDVEVGDILLVDGNYKCLKVALHWCMSALICRT